MLLAAVMVACQPAGQRVRPTGLWTLDPPDRGPPILCTTARAMPFRLVIDPSESNPVWGIREASDTRFDIIWPPGFGIGTTPEPVLIDSYGAIVGRNGSLIDRAGGSGGDPAFICSLDGVAYPLRPG